MSGVRDDDDDGMYVRPTVPTGRAYMRCQVSAGAVRVSGCAGVRPERTVR